MATKERMWLRLAVCLPIMLGVWVMWKMCVYNPAHARGGLSATDFLLVAGFIVLTVIAQSIAACCNKRSGKQLALLRLVVQDVIVLLLGAAAFVVISLHERFYGAEGASWGASLLNALWYSMTTVSAGLVLAFPEIVFGGPLPPEEAPAPAPLQ